MAIFSGPLKLVLDSLDCGLNFFKHLFIIVLCCVCVCACDSVCVEVRG